MISSQLIKRTFNSSAGLKKGNSPVEMGWLVTSVHGVSLEEVPGRLEHLVLTIRLTCIEEVFYDLITKN